MFKNITMQEHVTLGSKFSNVGKFTIPTPLLLIVLC